MQSRNDYDTGWWVVHSQAAMRRALREEEAAAAIQADVATGAEPAASQGPEEPQGSQQCMHASALDRCLIPITVQMLGKGVAHEAAAVLAPFEAAAKLSAPPLDLGKGQAVTQYTAQPEPRAAMPAMTQDRSHGADDQQQRSNARCSLRSTSGCMPSKVRAEQAQYHNAKLWAEAHEQGDETNSVKRARLDQGADLNAAARINKDTAAMPYGDADRDPVSRDPAARPAEEQQPAVSSTGKQPDLGNEVKLVFIGFVTSEAPRGLSGGVGAAALGSLAVLKNLFQEQTKTGVLKHNQHGIVVAIRNSGSQSFSRAALHQTDSLPWHKVLI